MPGKKTKQSKLKKRAGVFDVAREAGVSVATVSRAFNLPDLVSEDVRRRVLAISQRLGYAANPAAKALRSRKTHIVGAAIPTLDYAIFAKMINHFQDTFAQHGYITIVATTGFEHANVFEKVKTLVDRGAEALLLVGAIEDPALVRYLKEPHIPVVTTYSYIPEEIVPCIGFDNYAATQSAMEYLADLGHRNFAMIAGSPKGSDRQRTRIAAYKDFIGARQLEGEENIIIRDFTIRDGAEAMRALLVKYPDTTALVCNTDVVAFGALSESRRLGIRIPQDISVVGFDDAEYAAQLDPPLTTIAVPAEEMGRLSAEMLHMSLSTGESPRFVRLDSQLIVRKSACPPRGLKQLRLASAV
ncbi:LacI family transcriptional regulator [Mesorhizobium sp. M4B.F.Ca.ET.215.01.1.1]|uniref:LacI family DNA-binding transcriptional regulator n=3 Tax=Mesorhizobium TaxID=68287 RepID=UPI000FCCB2BA|nr:MULTISPECIES: LacI family DNA-binding transcriptional regulator [unclassified Mesorhizobium]RUW27118.1 LacI family transcriptional regulator [Mesorhizobium sp. M4B.F.Ca.ET.013.02.1.1]RUW77982.1 LacI family transcriptional regulator [Mesorhizobium sp. M4B.F.Ca.ET.049.02.1.2]RWF67132.1 MAG: LacI family transcriptional regulator [Mesorhizobium sp.]TGQ09540.1 LacI family transcriptional regulator [Mesorhizobium sp. M4B.F.Ca.ET.215.01.1.1]TGQ36974.1 LacI family transcriptional regulator [Mesorhi